MSRGEKAVSEVMGMILILAIMVMVIGAIMIVGVPMIEAGKDRGKMDVASNSFLSLQNDIEEVVRGPVWIQDPNSVTNPISGLGPSRATEFQLMSGTLSVQPNRTNVNCTPAPCGSSVNINIIIPASKITYTSGQEAIVYENGAVIRKYESGAPIMVSEPLINIYDNGSNGTVVSIHAITINSTNSSIGGDGIANVETRLINYSQIIQANSTPNTNWVNITIYTAYPQAWNASFDHMLNVSAELNRTGPRPGYTISGGSGRNPLRVNISGKGSNDIILSVYETRLDVKVG